MNQHLQELLDFIKKADHLTDEEKTALSKAAKAADKELEITSFKLERTEKVKHTTAILLEETIEELEQKRKAIEAQNRELEIESALEKVRSSSLAMYKSDELKQAVKVVFKELQGLDFAIDGAAFIVTPIENSKDFNVWIGDDHAEYPNCFRTPFYDTPSQIDIAKAIESGTNFFSRTYSFEEKNSWFRYAFEHTAYKTLPDHLKNWILEQQYLTQSMAWANKSGVGIHFHQQRTLTENEIDILKRFSKVFDQAYIRFLDLQKAEAQAREAQIQLALERVRARTMAMQHSNELQDAAIVLFEQVKALGFDTGSCGFNIWNTDEKAATVWVSSPEGGLQLPFKMPHTDSEIYKGAYDAMQNGDDFFIKEVKGDALTKHFDYLFSLQGIGVVIKKLRDANYTFPELMFFHFAFFKQGYLSFHGHKPDIDAKDIFKRFARVFEQTYTRFLDLQKAEAQAREAQIEAALEKVRSKTMGMQRSEQLAETASLLFKQIGDLSINVWSSGFQIWNADDISTTAWMNTEGGEIQAGLRLPHTEDPFFLNIYNARHNADRFFVMESKGKELEETYRYMFNIPEWKKAFGDIEASGFPIPKYQITHCVFFAQGYLMLITHESYAEYWDIFKRFGKVFEQTYTRFLDLQKAEAQAREAQIQLALERVRARTMAMQHSDEMAEAAALMFKQISELGIETWTSGFNIWQNNDSSFIGYNPSPTGGITPPYVIPSSEDHFFLHILKAKQAGEESIIFEWGNEQLEQTYRYMKTLPIIGEVLTRFESSGISLPTFQINHVIFFAQGFLLFITLKPYPEAHDIFKRFAKVFEQTYTRFLDLRKAEAQAREAQIEAALERVRSSSLAMHRSDELQGVVNTVIERLKELNFVLDTTNILIFNNNDRSIEYWTGSNSTGTQLNASWKVPYTDFSYFKAILLAHDTEQEIFTGNYPFEEKNKMFTYLFSETDFRVLNPERKKFIFESPGATIVAAIVKDIAIQIISYSRELFARDEVQIVKRFAKVFHQAYTRFLDLQKAEAQAREAKIEAALERVRSRTMAMQKSSDLGETSALLFGQLNALVPELWTCGFVLCDRNKTVDEWWLSGGSGFMPDLYLPNIGDALHNNIYNAWLNGESYYQEVIQGEALQQHYEWLMTIPSAKAAFAAQAAAGIKQPVWQQLSCAYFSRGYLVVITEKPCGEAKIFKRFAQVFEQTYTRFLDLQKAEAQARESQIQLALERVRARTMAMHSSEDVTTATETMFNELKKLGINNLRGGITNIHPNRTMDVFGVTNMVDGKTIKGFNFFSMDEHTIWQRLFESWKNNEQVFIGYLAGQEKENYIRVINSHQNYLPQAIKELPDTYFQAYRFDQGSVWSYSLQAHSEVDKEIMKRFASVFSLTFRRYQDLQKAEAQAREAQIEAGLERVRSQAMAMHNSEDLGITIEMFYEQVSSLLATPVIRCGTGLLNKENSMCELVTASKNEKGQVSHVNGHIDMAGHPMLQNTIDHWKDQKEYYHVLKGVEIKKYYQYMTNQLVVPDYSEHEEMHFYFPMFSEGSFYVVTKSELSAGELQVVRRFSSVLSLTYRRFNDLKKAEAQALEAIKRASVDRVRAEIASMRTTNDLERITPLIWNELTTLGIPFIRCGVFIMNNDTQQIETHLSTPNGEALATFNLPYNAPGETALILVHWRKRELYKQHWDEAQFVEFTQNLVQQRAISSGEKYLTENHPTDLYLHFLPFLQGMLYVGNTSPLKDDALQLVQNLADAFATAYARYEDFNKLELAKQQIEKTYSELKSTQSQLIQSEKMASLGELTAGIAHEIQNPLNFVNNFSEVSNELIEEMKQELATGHWQLASEIADDVKRNLEKILHHGKRADGIVKGMLQHSRTSSGQKEPTDINALCDEYVRLAYHGLRAKDKSFNAKFETDFDPSIPKINIVPQDIGRVVLNLINNAFYAVSEKKRNSNEKYQPTVIVSTKKLNDKIEIEVSDNGNGIPQNVVDKIFQPFFTTKPTGQGTGLGLSLSYDIVKAHGGDLKVETKQGEGSAFTIQLPIV